VLRVEKPSALSRDAPLSTVEESSVALRVRVAAIATNAQFGAFSLASTQLAANNAFVPLSLLQRAIGLPKRVNTLLVGASEGAALTPTVANTALWNHWHLADAGLVLREYPTRQTLELSTENVFLDAPVAHAAQEAVPGAQGVLTYFVNELKLRDRATPYSVVSALEGTVVPPDMADNETLINEWLAEDLGARVGDTLTMKYYVVGPLRRLTEETRQFRVRGILPITGAAADPSLMPPFPGVADAENCRDWRPGIPIELNKIRDKDEAYWDQHHGTPKAFITLKAGQAMWNNRFGNLTAIRYPKEGRMRGAAEQSIRQALNPASVGLFFLPVREQALTASSQSLDFAQLFLGFSFFLIFAALLLTALLTALSVEQRAEEVGILLAVGVPPRQVQRLLLTEGAVVALVAGLIGAPLGVLYTQAVIRGLSTVWSDAVGGSTLQFAVTPGTLAGGAAAGFAVALLAIWLVTRKQAKAPARALLAAGTESESLATPARSGRAPGSRTALFTGVTALALVIVALGAGHEWAAAVFFGAGALFLISGIAACRRLLAGMEQDAGARTLTVGSLGVRNSARRWGRSLSAIALLACGSFLVIAVGASRHDPNHDAEKRSSGTGGFALYGETTLPIYEDLNSEKGREAFGLDSELLADTKIVPLRMRSGDEASCLNLNRVQSPRVLGIDPTAMSERGSFTFAGVLDKAAAKDPWSLLNRPDEDGVIPAIGDTNTVTWSLGKSIGDLVPMVDDRGNPVQLRIVGIVANSILQGSLLVSEQNFLARFPAQSGYQAFLVDVPRERQEEVRRELTQGLQDAGMALTPAPERLAEFSAVENTYLSIFAVLGGLGLLLGSVGLGIVVLRNVLERRGELALLRAVGFRGRALHWLVFSEHSLLLALGLATGVVAALVAIFPVLSLPGADVPYGSLAITLLAVLLTGLACTWGATAIALRGLPARALRNE
jgi:ABC-type antimicrobial peptide transport system permease subunit